MLNNSKFSYTVNALKAIGILAIVASHLGISFGGKIFPVSSWHVPLFFVVSGYLFNFNKTNFLQKIKKYIKIFYSYYFFYAFITFLIYLFLHKIYGSLPSLKTLTWASLSYIPFSIFAPAWFLQALILCSLLFFLVIKFSEYCKISKLAPFMFLIFGILAVNLTNSDFSPMVGANNGVKKVIVRTLMGSFYMYAGYFYKCKLKNFIKFSNKEIVCVLFIQILLYIFVDNLDMSIYLGQLPHNIAPFIAPFTAIYTLTYLIKKIPQKFLKNRIVYNTGTMSLNIMMNHIFAIFITEIIVLKLTHQPLTMLPNDIFQFYNIESFKVLYLCSAIIICLTLGKLSQKILCKKDNKCL